MRTRQFDKEVLFVEDPIVGVGRSDIDLLKARARANERRRIRLCIHRDVEEPLHEMLIVHTRDTYVRPHKHVLKTESFHIIEGSAELFVFDEDGTIRESIALGEYGSGQHFYYRLTEPVFHTLLILSDVLVFHETAPGPFRRADIVLAPWAPEEGNVKAVEAFLDRLRSAAPART